MNKKLLLIIVVMGIAAMTTAQEETTQGEDIPVLSSNPCDANDDYYKVVCDASGNIIEETFGGNNPFFRFRFDENGNPIEETEFIDGVAFTTLKQYDNNLLSQTIKPDGTIIDIERDNDGKNIKETTSFEGEKEIVTFDYTETGELWGVGCNQDSTVPCETYTYTDDGDVATYSFYNLNLIQSINEHNQKTGLTSTEGEKVTYHYTEDEQIARLDHVDFFGIDFTTPCGFFNDFSFDQFCNMLADDQFSYQYQGGLLSSITDVSSGETSAYTYNADQEIIEILSSKGKETFEYNALGQKIGYVDYDGNAFSYLIPGDDSSLVTKNQIAATVGDMNIDGQINFQDYILGLEKTVSQQSLFNIVLRWIKT